MIEFFNNSQEHSEDALDRIYKPEYTEDFVILNGEKVFIKKIGTHVQSEPYIFLLDLHERGIYSFDEIKGLTPPNSNISYLDAIDLGKNIIQEIDFRQDQNPEQKQDSGVAKSLYNIRFLNLSENQIEEIKNLEVFAGLKYLNLKWNSIYKIRNLEKLTKLKCLILDNNKISSICESEGDYNPFKGLRELEYLSMNNNLLETPNKKDFGPLENLKILLLNDNSIGSLEFVQALEKLEVLHLDGNMINLMAYLNKLRNLKYLSLAHNQIKEISNLENLPQLQVLDLSYNQISELKNLEALINLIELDLSGNIIKRVMGLEALKSLKILNLRGNMIRSIHGIGSLEYLEEIYLDDNHIAKLNDLGKLSSLRKLTLKNNKIKDVSFLNRVRSLKFLNLAINPLVNIEGLQSLTNLEYLNLFDTPIFREIEKKYKEIHPIYKYFKDPQDFIKKLKLFINNNTKIE
ncbi:MAG: leucine-rich repeat domain-containing protein [Promethearchaeota archaeon]